MFNIGDIVEYIDPIDSSITSIGTVRLVEPAPDGGEFIYFRANDETMNYLSDPRIPGGYHAIAHSSTGLIRNLQGDD